MTTKNPGNCTHPERYKEEVDCGDYIAVRIYCVQCNAFIIQINKYKDSEKE